MVEIRYGDQYEVTDLAGRTVSEAREQFRKEFGIPEKATAKLNGSKVKASTELDTVLNDDDRLTFAVSKGKGAYLVGALLLALAVTGSVFAFGFINASVSLTGTAASTDFATVNTSGAGPSWTAYGFFKGTIGSGPIFYVDTTPSGYAGDLVVTVSLANAADLVKAYRVLALTLEMRDGSGNLLDINEDTTNLTADDYVILSLDNGSVSMFPNGANSTRTIWVKSGFYITHIHTSSWGSTSPLLFAEVAQRG